MKPEALIKARIRAWLVSRGAYYFAPVQMGMGIATLDILCCVKGRFVGIEVKIPGKRPTARQHATIRSINDAGGIAFWADSLEHVQWELEEKGL